MPFIPLQDDNPRIMIARPIVTWAIIATCIVVFILQAAAGPQAAQAIAYSFGLIPAVLMGVRELSPDLAVLPAWATLITAMFLHGGFMHLAGNMLFLGVFGDNIEDSMGHGRFVVFYLICGAAASLSHVLIAPGSTTPMIGASGAISGVLGAYLILHPKAWVTILLFFFPLRFPAWLLLVGWIGFQLFAALGGGASGGVAWWAHIGGFAAGAALIAGFRHKSVPLWGGGNHPKGIRIKRPPRQQSTQPSPGTARRQPRNKRPGPWG
ncbi:rhomboid family intramembrane serine protease [Rhodovibrio salinarum]|uniref:Rhomboid family intramembrane serine protease n=1 Tax=Rhodovibrio salinarum TaxID=1087 RepID=A0A934UZ28_9PROT|nr:rhomboid family intramembrane serine protease [Rhodovibrio salinarum]MBK1696657.1 rhomboid family intramembrane serine protease [Rhodovibrio salinarum]